MATMRDSSTSLRERNRRYTPLYMFLLSICFLFSVQGVLRADEGRFVSPFRDVCWDCLFPITISGANVTPGHKDFGSSHDLICECPGLPPKVGIPLTFWEPTYLVDVTRHAYKLIGVNGVSLGREGPQNRGSVGITSGGPSRHSFYHVHLYHWPVLDFLGVLTDFPCLSKGDLDLVYMSELDPMWNDEVLNHILNPEAAFFATPEAQAACIADCTQSSSNNPSDTLFWCGGCQGSLYPFTGTVAHHVGAIQASSLLVQRVLAKLHRSYMLKGFEKGNYCEALPVPLLKKRMYKMQMAHPIPQRKGPCHALGKTDALWGGGKSFPKEGEDFVYLLWTKKQCCLDAVKPSIGSSFGSH